MGDGHMGTRVAREQFAGMTYEELLDEVTWTHEFLDRMGKHCGTKDCPSLVAYVNGLEDENAKLRDTTYAWRTVDRLSCENAKLRELVRDMWRCGAFEPGACYADGIEDLETRTRELGIEV